MTDLEQRLRDAMTASVEQARPSFGAQDVRRRQRSHVKRVAAASVAATAMLAVAVALVPRVWSGASSERPAGRASGQYVDPTFGWKLSYPRGWVPGNFRDDRGAAVAAGIRITSFAPDLSAPGGGSPAMGWLRAFPAGGAAVQVWMNARVPPLPPLRDSIFPLSPASFAKVRRYVGGNEPRPLYRVFYGDGLTFNAAVWLGPRASQADRDAAWAIVRSIRFPALAQHTVWQGQSYVLAKAGRYPVGSVSYFPVSSLPRGGLVTRGGFYLIHAPRAFYVIFATYGPSVAATCHLAYDASHREFSCPGKKLRWNLSGQPIGRPAAPGADGALGLHIATVAQDGHVLFDPFFGALLGARLNGSPWS